MKKIIALLFSLAFGTACLGGCTKEAFTPKSYTADGTQVSEIRIDVHDRQIEVVASADNQIHIDYFENSKEYYDLSISDDAVLTMASVRDKKWTDYIGGKPAAGSRKIVLQLPATSLKALKLATTNEDVSLVPLTVSGDVWLSSQGGNIAFDQLNVGTAMRLNAKNGDITGSIVGDHDDYTISCDIKKGKSNLPSNQASGAKKLNASNNNGNIAIEFVSK